MLGRRALLMTGLAATLPRLAHAQAGGGEILRWAVPELPASLDPLASAFAGLPLLCDTLTDPDWGLADSCQFIDPATLVIDLIPRINFHDGTLCASDSVKLNLDRYKGSAALSAVDDILVLGRFRLQLHLARPDPALLATLAGPTGRIVAPSSFGRDPVGTGPFKLATRTGERLSLIRNEGYRKPDLPRLDGVQIVAAADPESAVSAGKADLAGASRSPRLHDVTPNLAEAWLG